MKMENKSLKLSQKFATYLEKHRIFELLQELSTMLLIKKPDDHLLFIKQSIYHAARRLDAPRLIILAPPDFDKLELANKLRCDLGIPLIQLTDITCDTRSINSTVIIEGLRFILMNYMKNNCDGWIFPDFPRTEEEARKLQRIGIIPTHVIEIVVSNPSNEEFLNRDYYTELRGLRRVFSKFITTITVEKDDSESVREKCLSLVKSRKYSRLASMFRILLIDFVDSARCRRLGQYIAQLTNVTFIDFKEILERVCLQDTDFADRVRDVRSNVESDDLPSEMKSEIFQQYLWETNMFDKGWVLSGLVSSVDDFKHIDMTDTSPNRVLLIIPESGEALCEDKTLNDTESKDSCDSSTSVTTESIDLCDSSTITDKTESKDSCDCLTSESESIHTCICEESMREILRYAGESASVIRDHRDSKVLKERIDFCLVQPPPCVPPRMPREPPEVKPEDVEFDPDDEPSTAILRGIREPEPILTLV